MYDHGHKLLSMPSNMSFSCIQHLYKTMVKSVRNIRRCVMPLKQELYTGKPTIQMQMTICRWNMNIITMTF
jgi:hypothetical protein